MDSTTASTSSVSATGRQDGAALVPISDIGRTKRPRHSTSLFLPGPEALITLPGRVTLTQPITFDADTRKSKESKSKCRHASSDGASSDHDLLVEDLDLAAGEPPDFDYLAMAEEAESTRKRAARRKKARQHTRWIDIVVPLLIPLHLRLLRETESLRSSPKHVSSICSCKPGRSLTVMCLYFQRALFLSLLRFSDNLGIQDSNILSSKPANAAQLHPSFFPKGFSLAPILSLLSPSISLFYSLLAISLSDCPPTLPLSRKPSSVSLAPKDTTLHR
jgi:hypothetical protein